MSQIIDTAVVLALFRNEPGTAVAAGLVPSGHMSSVNLSESVSKLFDYGEIPDAAWKRVLRLNLTIHPFDTEAARIAASLRPISRPFGLSFADRACLALGIKLGLPAYTADRMWAKLKIGVDIRLIR